MWIIALNERLINLDYIRKIEYTFLGKEYSLWCEYFDGRTETLYRFEGENASENLGALMAWLTELLDAKRCVDVKMVKGKDLVISPSDVAEKAKKRTGNAKWRLLSALNR